MKHVVKVLTAVLTAVVVAGMLVVLVVKAWGAKREKDRPKIPEWY